MKKKTPGTGGVGIKNGAATITASGMTKPIEEEEEEYLASDRNSQSHRITPGNAITASSLSLAAIDAATEDPAGGDDEMEAEFAKGADAENMETEEETHAYAPSATASATEGNTEGVPTDSLIGGM